MAHIQQSLFDNHSSHYLLNGGVYCDSEGSLLLLSGENERVKCCASLIDSQCLYVDDSTHTLYLASLTEPSRVFMKSVSWVASVGDKVNVGFLDGSTVGVYVAVRPACMGIRDMADRLTQSTSLLYPFFVENKEEYLDSPETLVFFQA
jgi:prepilin-type processing-associated H-X9-DG protein